MTVWLSQAVAGPLAILWSCPLRLVFPAPNCGGFAKVESVVAGFQWGFRFLSLLMLTLGLAVALL
jgi:hypothetical protein